MTTTTQRQKSPDLSPRKNSVEVIVVKTPSPEEIALDIESAVKFESSMMEGTSVDEKEVDEDMVRQQWKYLETLGFAKDKPLRPDSNGNLSVHIAAMNNMHDMVRHLITQGRVPLNSQGQLGDTPLGWAADKGHVKTVRTLLELRADPGRTRTTTYAKKRQTPLWVAAVGNHSEVVRLLIEYQANVDIPEQECNQTPLWSAACAGHRQVVDILLEASADVTIYGRPVSSSLRYTPQGIAKKCGKKDVYEAIIAYTSENRSRPTTTTIMGTA